MRILICDDDLVSRVALGTVLRRMGHEVEEAGDGAQALQRMQAADAPRLAILDWMMPGLNGVQVLEALRAHPGSHPPYLIMLSVRNGRDDIVAVMESGADDYLIKPFDSGELFARIEVARRVIWMADELQETSQALFEAREHVRLLQSLFPLCPACGCLRGDQAFQAQAEAYLQRHRKAMGGRGACPACQVRAGSSETPRG